MRVLSVQRSGMVPASLARYRALHDLGVEVGLACARTWPEGGALFATDSVREAFPVYGIPTVLTGRGPYYLYVPGIGDAVKRFRPDLIHLREEVFTVSAGQFHLERRLRFRSVPFIFESWQNIRKRYPWPASWFERIGYRDAAGAIAGIPSVEPVLRAGGFRGAVEVVPLGGIDPEMFNPDGGNLRDELGAAQKLIGYVGRLAPEKGVADLVLAAAQLGPDVRLVLVGDGPQRTELETLSRGKGVDAIYLGGVAQNRLPSVLRSLDVLVLPSRTTATWKEQWGRVLTESMACGTPVVGSDSAEIPFVIGDAGLVFPEGSIPGLADALKRILEDRGERQRLAAAGIVRARQFTWNRLAVKIRSFYQRILEEHRGIC